LKPRNIEAQVDFSGGQIDVVALRRDDSKLARSSVRRARNCLPSPTGAAETRMGRKLLSVGDIRSDDIKMASGSRYILAFRAGSLIVRDRTSAVALKTFAGQPWNAAQCFALRWDLFGDQIIICMAGMKTKVVDAVGAPAGWSIADFAFETGQRGQLLQPYIRIAPRGVAIQPAAYTGSGVTLTASAAVFLPGHQNQRIRYYGYEMLITGYTDAQNVTVTVIEDLPRTYSLTASGAGQTFTGFKEGDVCNFKTNSVECTVSQVISTSNIHVVVAAGAITFISDEIIGPRGRCTVQSPSLQSAPDPLTNWDEPAISDLRGWPASVTADLARVAFCQIPSFPDAIAWSSINAGGDFGVTGDPDGSIFERIRGQPRVVDVAPGPDIFVLTDAGVFYIPVSADNPLVSGSVEFRPIAEVGVHPTVRCQTTGDAVLFVDSGSIGVWAVVQTGQTTRPYIVRELTPRCRDLVNDPVALAYQTGQADNPDQLAYAVMADGTVICGRFDPVEENVGWFQWDSVAGATWVSSRTTGALLNSRAVIVGVERLYTEEFSASALTDVEVDPVSATDALNAGKPGGAGPLWMFAGAMVRLRRGARDWGDRRVNALGSLVTIEGDDISGSGWRVGTFFSNEVGPFVWHADPGPSRKQRHRRRRLARSAWTMQRNCGFEIEDGTGRLQQRAAHQLRDNQTVEAPLRLEEHRFRHTMSGFDPFVLIRQTTVGRLSLIEFSPEVEI